MSRSLSDITLDTCEALLASGHKPSRDAYNALTVLARTTTIDWSRYPLTQTWFSQIG